ncbi:PilZ domain-containing protein [Polycladidibacter hongkongensis]|uniref:PilZ domain-containing protein n=1 Tax=Polycladidibacter hongkongensis TaxID=1647556 RepID=UPI00082DBF2D|nr:PilZ domain-containing protein [Pseudovibrio hongkongensis]
MEDSERRQSQRKRTLKEGRIVFGDNSVVYDCIVRDLSAIGAKLKMESTQGIPEEFQLFLVHTRQKVKVETRWRTANELGVEFIGEPEQLSGLVRL